MKKAAIQTIVLAAGLAVGLSATANAGNKFEIGTGIPGGSFDASHDRYGTSGGSSAIPGSSLPVTSPRRRACRRAFLAVKDRGYENITTLECKGKHYSFSGLRNGKWWKIKVRASSGKVRNAYPL